MTDVFEEDYNENQIQLLEQQKEEYQSKYDELDGVDTPEADAGREELGTEINRLEIEIEQMREAQQQQREAQEQGNSQLDAFND